MADLGFPRREVPTPKAAVLNYYLVKISQKLHENERNWTQAGHILGAPFDPPMVPNGFRDLKSQEN